LKKIYQPNVEVCSLASLFVWTQGENNNFSEAVEVTCPSLDFGFNHDELSLELDNDNYGKNWLNENQNFENPVSDEFDINFDEIIYDYNNSEDLIFLDTYLDNDLLNTLIDDSNDSTFLPNDVFLPASNPIQSFINTDYATSRKRPSNLEIDSLFLDTDDLVLFDESYDHVDNFMSSYLDNTVSPSSDLYNTPFSSTNFDYSSSTYMSMAKRFREKQVRNNEASKKSRANKKLKLTDCESDICALAKENMNLLAVQEKLVKAIAMCEELLVNKMHNNVN
jgi:hypothetical protein